MLDHIGASLSEPLAHEARETMAAAPNYRWLGGLPHGTSRARIRRAHVLVHMSRMEGGAHVVMEALRSGTPVLASRIDGNFGLLGSGYEGVFEPGDDAALAALLARARDEADMLPRLTAQLAARSHLFNPAAEQAALHRIIGALRARPLNRSCP